MSDTGTPTPDAPEVLTPDVVPASSVPALTTMDDRVVTKYLDDMKNLAEHSDDDVQRAIVGRILASETAADVLAPQAIEHARDLVDQHLTLTGVRVQESDFEEGPGIYAVVNAVVMEDGRTTTFSCGGSNVLAQLYRLAQLNALPCDVVIKRSTKPTKAGYYPLWLEAVGGAAGRSKQPVAASVETGDAF